MSNVLTNTELGGSEKNASNVSLSSNNGSIRSATCLNSKNELNFEQHLANKNTKPKLENQSSLTSINSISSNGSSPIRCLNNNAIIRRFSNSPLIFRFFVIENKKKKRKKNLFLNKTLFVL